MTVRLAVLFPLLALVLSGCTAGGTTAGPTTLPAVSPVPSVVSSPSAVDVAPSVPPEAQANTAQGAAAFARFWLAELSSAFSTGVSGELRSLSDARCETCRNFVSAVDKQRMQGRRVIGGQFVIRLAEASEEANYYVVDVLYDRQPLEVRDASGKIIDRAPANSGQMMQFAVVRTGNVKLVRAIRFPQQGGQ